MTDYSLGHLSNETLLRNLDTLVVRDRITTAQLLAHLSEVDARKLYAPAGYPSMFAYCVQQLHFSEDAAYKRIQAARAARQFPALFTAVAEGRLHLTGVGLLAPHLTRENANELLDAAADKSKLEIEEMLAERFPRSELLRMPPVQISGSGQLAPAQVEPCLEKSERVQIPTKASPVPPLARMSTAKPIASGRYGLHFTIDQATQDKLRHAEALLSHAIADGDLARIFDRALDALIERLEKRKFAGTKRPRRSIQGTTHNSRHIPAHVRRAVWQRDGGQCTFVSDHGRRCASRHFLEFDHVNPVARGGAPTIGNVRLRCRTHNQYVAECAFGVDFMHQKRQEARERAAAATRRAEAREHATQTRLAP